MSYEFITPAGPVLGCGRRGDAVIGWPMSFAKLSVAQPRKSQEGLKLTFHGICSAKVWQVVGAQPTFLSGCREVSNIPSGLDSLLQIL